MDLLLSASNRRSHRFSFMALILYIILLIICAFFLIPHYDIFYYWDWSRHLALSYYDGPPLLAYSLYLVSHLFGDRLYVICLLGVLFTLLTAFFIYKLTALFTNKKAALTACSLWLFSPLTAQFLVRYFTYDSPLNLFWAITLYFTAKYIIEQRHRFLYWAGASAGLMLLSKYTGIILICSLLLFLILQPKLQRTFTNKHFYLSILCSLLAFSPVIIWNLEHHWISFTYQLNTHALNTPHLGHRLLNTLNILKKGFLPVMNFLGPITLYGLIKSRKKGEPHLIKSLLLTVTVCFYVFYLIATLNTQVRTSWLIPGLISLTILTAYYLELYQLNTIRTGLLGLYLTLSLVVLLANTVFATHITVEGARYELVQQFNHRYPPTHETMITSGYMPARLVFFLAGQPAIYTVPHCDSQNEYALWSAPIIKKITQGKIKRALYFDLSDRHSCMSHYFSHCDAMPTVHYNVALPWSHRTHHYSLYLYQCYNN